MTHPPASAAHCSAYIATSLDGFIARTDGSIDWLEAAQAGVPPGEDCGYAAYMAGIDAIVMGRNTFEKVLSFPSWPYALPVYVLSRRWDALAAGAPASATLWRGDVADLARHAAAQGHARLYIDGGLALQSFLAAGLLREITVTRIPVLLGEGLPLFGPLPQGDVALQHLATRSWDFGFVQSHYRIG